MSQANWRRVNRAHPCPICGGPDWCLVAADGGAAICPRIESRRRAGEAGFLHRLGQSERRRPLVRSLTIGGGQRGRADLADLARQYQDAAEPGPLGLFALQMGLTVAGLRALAIGWTGWAWSFPMQDAGGNTLGIRLRFPDGRKLAVKGGREGLFIPRQESAPEKSPFLICEGPTDTAALIDMGFPQVVGRPSCTGGIKLLVELVQTRQAREVVIVADGDEPGQRGADNLAAVLAVYVPAVRVIRPPDGIKDARDWLRKGGTLADVEMVIQAATVRRLTIRTRKVGNHG